MAVAQEGFSVNARSSTQSRGVILSSMVMTNPATASAVASSVAPAVTSRACFSAASRLASSKPPRAKHHSWHQAMRALAAV